MRAFITSPAGRLRDCAICYSTCLSSLLTTVAATLNGMLMRRSILLNVTQIQATSHAAEAALTELVLWLRGSLSTTVQVPAGVPPHHRKAFISGRSDYGRYGKPAVRCARSGMLKVMNFVWPQLSA